jgi:hypothetical protein
LVTIVIIEQAVVVLYNSELLNGYEDNIPNYFLFGAANGRVDHYELDQRRTSSVKTLMEEGPQ